MSDHPDGRADQLGEEIRHAVEAPPTRIVVVGGGMAGLVVARECARPGFAVTLLEGSERVGGSVAPLAIGGMTLDAGAESFATRGGHVAELLDDLGLTGDVVQPNLGLAPDLVENHGLIKGKNAEFALALLNAMRDAELGDGKVVFDETIHGMVNNVDSPFKKLFQFPYVIVLLLVLAATALLAWATTSRFGKPRLALPAFDLGKERLITNTATLLDRAGHQAFVMRRYVRATLRDVGRLFHAPRQLDDEKLAEWLDKIGESRGLETRASVVLARAEEGQGTSLTGLFQATRDIHDWKEEISDGTAARRPYR